MTISRRRMSQPLLVDGARDGQFHMKMLTRSGVSRTKARSGAPLARPSNDGARTCFGKVVSLYRSMNRCGEVVRGLGNRRFWVVRDAGVPPPDRPVHERASMSAATQEGSERGRGDGDAPQLYRMLL